jgi:hypothetical protein
MISCTTRIALEVHCLGIRGGGYQGTPLLHPKTVRTDGFSQASGGRLAALNALQQDVSVARIQ